MAASATTMPTTTRISVSVNPRRAATKFDCGVWFMREDYLGEELLLRHRPEVRDVVVRAVDAVRAGGDQDEAVFLPRDVRRLVAGVALHLRAGQRGVAEVRE